MPKFFAAADALARLDGDALLEDGDRETADAYDAHLQANDVHLMDLEDARAMPPLERIGVPGRLGHSIPPVESKLKIRTGRSPSQRRPIQNFAGR